jgi:hypothetical protein
MYPDPSTGSNASVGVLAPFYSKIDVKCSRDYLGRGGGCNIGFGVKRT